MTLSDRFFLGPVFLHGFSASCHLLLLLTLSLFWFFRRVGGGSSRKEDRVDKNALLHYKITLSACLILFLLFMFVCIYDRHIATQLDTGVRAITWLATSAYIHFVFLPSSDRKIPTVLSVWWGIFFLISSSSIALDFLCYRKLGIMEIHLWVLDFGSLMASIVVNFTGFFGKTVEDGSNRLHESLLNEASSPNDAEMEVQRGYGNVSLFTNASFFSVLTFSWISPLLAVGNKKTLDLKDVPQLDKNDNVDGVVPIFISKLESCNSDGRGNNELDATHLTSFSLAKALISSSWKLVFLTSIYVLLSTLASYVGPYLMDYFVQYLNGHQTFANGGYILVVAFIVANLLECISKRQWHFRLLQIGMRVRVFLVSIIYQKGLTLSSNARQGRSTGEIINIMSVDADRIALFAWYLHDLWKVPLQIALALLILYARLGLASLAALAASFGVMLVNIPLGKLENKYQEKLMESKDIRMKSTSEILRNMRILKLQGWEMKFLAKITELRKNEINWLKKYAYMSAMTTYVFWGAPIFVAVVTFGTCVLMGIPLESGKVLSALATFRVLQEPIYTLPDTISMVIQTKVSLDRLSSFLCLEELQKDVVEKLPRGSSDVAIELINGTFSWDLSLEPPTLRDLNFKVLQGMRVAVCGTVGSGKSSLLACILGEVPKIAGTIKLCGSTAYVAQSPWIQSGNIQENILFGKVMDIEKYDNVLEACSLKMELEILPFGDQTVIGERGINLSGGQKQRIQIARALYQEADIFLFDDPFSAVDAHTGSHLFKECLLGLLSSKTIIYVTHQVDFLPSADLILVMKDGKITQIGKYNDIVTSGSDLMELIGAHKEALSALDNTELAKDSSKTIDGSSNSKNNKPTLNEDEKDSKNSKSNESEFQKAQLVQEEEREKGRVGFWVYWKYITTAYKGALVPVILLAETLFQVLQIASNYWMAWAAPVSKDVKAPVNVLTLIYVYIALALGSSTCILIRAFLVAVAALKTATVMFNKMLFSIFRAPMSFFDSTPSGRILSRASTDQNDVDTVTPYLISSVAFTLIQLGGMVAVMSQVAWQVFIVFIPMIGLSFWYQRYYIETARELARLMGMFKAPIIQHFSESLSGSTTIRSFNEESRFVNINSQRLDECNRPRFHSACAMEWLCFRLNVLSSIMFAFSLIFLSCLPRGVIDPGIAGLAVTYGLNLNMLQTWVIWSLCNLENRIISVERIVQYSNISSEPSLVIETSRPDGNWPSMGEVDLRDLQVRYAPHMPLVLKGLTCIFPGGLKTGIVGRTGSGKSTLIQTLFRIIDPCVGQIVIDGIDISTIGLHDLRSKLSIIPQDPTMFEGTVRSNLDPLEEYTDEQIWEALDCCQLGDEVRKKVNKLDSVVTENGENWSVGQRQLACLGRVILKRSKVLVLDEATASVDTATDNLIQKTLSQMFLDSTVIAIAHRITSVLDSDMVILLDDGLIAEHDTPTRLLENKSSLFAKLVAEYSLRSNFSYDKLNTF
ncbi:ABC transporter C family member 3 [Platanthera guangdongensis]|uniref:ABC transporter C family member 3 n=1 Tax=Platanthera guangdongensis TaxID=2320717 RepID=A0ABR2M117_9ASPA